MKKLLFILWFCFLALSCQKKEEESVKEEKPNIVFIFADDQIYNSINALGNDEIITPQLNKLVQEGTTFTHAYNMGSWSGAVCVASRAMLNTGRTVWRANEFRQEKLDSKKIQQTWAKLLSSHGYETYMTGKWHVEIPVDSVFDHVTHERPGMPKDAWNHDQMVFKFDSLSRVKNGDDRAIMPIGYNRPQNESDTLWSPTNPKFGGFWEGGKHWTEVLKDDAVQFLDQAKTSDKPFFMYLAFNAPHDPRQAPEQYLSMYPIENISLPKSFLPEYPFRYAIKNGNDLRDEALAPFPRTDYAIKKHTQEYYASISYLDHQLGFIMKALEETGKMDNTYVIFAADHGLAMGRHGLLGKQSLFDHSIRAPLIILGPDIPENEKNNSDVYLQDLMATTLDIAGIEKPAYIEFNSFLEQAKEKLTKNNYKSIYGGYLDVQRMIRKDGFKLLVFPKINKLQLFDLQNDPEEMVDLSADEQYLPKIKILFDELVTSQKELEDPLNLSVVYSKYLH